MNFLTLRDSNEMQVLADAAKTSCMKKCIADAVASSRLRLERVGSGSACPEPHSWVFVRGRAGMRAASFWKK